jgi:hypothetical protein
MEHCGASLHRKRIADAISSTKDTPGLTPVDVNQLFRRLPEAPDLSAGRTAAAILATFAKATVFEYVKGRY